MSASGDDRHPAGEQLEQAAGAPSSPLVERMLAEQSVRAGAPRAGVLVSQSVVSWSQDRGVLDDGTLAALASSCVLEPCEGDTVIVWRAGDGGGAGTRGDAPCAAVLAVLARSAETPQRWRSPAALELFAPSLTIRSERVGIDAGSLLVWAQESHSVFTVLTESVRTRVSDVVYDVRRAAQRTDEVSGTLFQRAGLWLSHTLREARMHAKATLFD